MRRRPETARNDEEQRRQYRRPSSLVLELLLTQIGVGVPFDDGDSVRAEKTTTKNRFEAVSDTVSDCCSDEVSGEGDEGATEESAVSFVQGREREEDTHLYVPEFQ